MKKTLLLLTAMSFAVLIPMESQAQRRSGECSYTPLQEYIRSIRREEDVKQLIAKNVDLNVKNKCGGSVLQLAIQRGNPQVVRALLEAGVDYKSPVSLDGFNIPNAPKEVPFFSFAAYYAPRADIINLLLSAEADVTQLDSNGENVLWYIRKNPVLRDTDLEDQLSAILLYKSTRKTVDEGTIASNPRAGMNAGGNAGQSTAAQRRQAARELVEPDMPVENPEAKIKSSNF
ncbi:MAG: ankyrin repeat domain-containing protein [Lactobacillales bacterium]|jgi:ankyrin repeat protein|nr:ankyrin repeat domain-containing protein [Lactobacillales bacterium]